MAEQVAAREWHTRALVRVLETTKIAAVDPPDTRIFRAGEECEMIQWGHAGRPVTRDAWWDSYDVDGAHIIRAHQVEVIKVLDEVSPE